MLKKMKKGHFSKFLFITFFFTFLGSLSSQTLSKKEERELLDKAEYYYSEKYYKTAGDFFGDLNKNKPNDPYYKLMLGICYTHIPAKHTSSLELLKDVKKQNPDFNEVNRHLGRAYAVNHMFDDAINQYEIYLRDENLEQEEKSEARRMIDYCENAKKLIKDSLTVEIKNIGNPVNTKYEEYVPLITPDESILIYTYRGIKSLGGKMDRNGKPDENGDYYEDILISYKKDKIWSEPVSIGENINTNRHDASIALSVSGQELFIYKSTPKDKGDIYISRLEGATWSKPQKLEGDINTEYWEGSASLSADGKTLYFSSERPDGFGGRDLYSAELQEDGTWKNVQNLGSTINTKFNEDAVFIHPDQKTLYFSSEGLSSMGGYDIFYTYLENDGWTEPVNVGYPVNTIGDDRFYVLSADGNTGYYSTGGKNEDGGHDIYTVTPGNFGKKPVLALVVGITSANEEPAQADITVTNLNTGEETNHKSNSNTGKYMLALTPGSKYKIAVEIEGYDPLIEYLDVESLDTYVQLEHDLKVFSKDFDKGKIEVAEKDQTLQQKLEKQIEKYKESSKDYGYETYAYARLLKEYGNQTEEGREYFVDLGYDFPGVDGKGPFSTLQEAEDYRQSMIEKDPKNKGLRIMVKQENQKQTVQEYFEKDLKQYAYEKKNLHNEITGNDTTKTNDKPITELNNNKILEDERLQNVYSKKIDGVSFKVEIGAFTDTTNVDLSHLEKYGKINKKTYPDGVTRYSFGPFNTLEEAENFRKNLVSKEKKNEDAFVTVFVFGQRQSLEEFAENDIIKPKEGPCDNQTFVDFSDLVGKDLNDKAVYAKLLSKGGNLCAEGLVFKVQIGAYRFPENFKYPYLAKFGTAKVTDYPDGITRFTMFEFITLNEAEKKRQEIIKAGQWDAWITPFYNGKRMLMEDLIKVNFYGRSVN